ncbi:MAG: hypothetical protein JWO39_127 [Gemmatimonadetes bacterium]|jgi:hypothetical protein|nr:hypothetical protein [Gemmatimonadota bacterium]
MTFIDEYKTPDKDYNYSITVNDGNCDYTTDGRFTPPPMIVNR